MLGGRLSYVARREVMLSAYLPNSALVLQDVSLGALSPDATSGLGEASALITLNSIVNFERETIKLSFFFSSFLTIVVQFN